MIQILLAACNGEKHIGSLLDSVFSQTVTDFEIIVRDDGSVDNTVGIINEYIKAHPGKIRLIDDNTPSGCARNNFFRLLKNADAEYIMLCDQDDIWLPDKIEVTLKKMKDTESGNIPVLIHTDLSVVDDELNILNKSFFNMQHFNGNMKHTLGYVTAQNVVTGCTIMINKPLLEVFKAGNGDAAIMHDWWLALLAAAFGKIAVIKKPTILYRQHGHNSVGAKKMRYMSRKEMSASVIKTIKQADGILGEYGNRLSSEQRALLSDYAGILKVCPVRRLLILERYKISKSPFIKKLMQYITIIRLK